MNYFDNKQRNTEPERRAPFYCNSLSDIMV